MKRGFFPLLLLIIFTMSISLLFSCGEPPELKELSALEKDELPDAIANIAYEKLGGFDSYSSTLDGMFILRNKENDITVDITETTVKYKEGTSAYSSLKERSIIENSASLSRTIYEACGYYNGYVYYEYSSPESDRKVKAEASLSDYIAYESIRDSLSLDMRELTSKCYSKSGKITSNDTLEASFTDLSTEGITDAERLVGSLREYIGSDWKIENASIVIRTDEELSLSSAVIDIFFAASGASSNTDGAPTLTFNLNYFDMGKEKKPERDLGEFTTNDALLEVMTLQHKISGILNGEYTKIKKSLNSYEERDGVKNRTSTNRTIVIENQPGGSFYYDIKPSPSLRAYGTTYVDHERISKVYNLMGNVISSTTYASSDDVEMWDIRSEIDPLYFSAHMADKMEKEDENKYTLTCYSPSDRIKRVYDKKSRNLINYEATVTFSLDAEGRLISYDCTVLANYTETHDSESVEVESFSETKRTLSYEAD